MTLRVHIELEVGPETAKLFVDLLAELKTLRTQMSATDDAIANLRNDIASLETVEQQALAYLAGVPALIKQAVADALNSSGGNAQALADQINQFANTVAADSSKLASGVLGAPAEAKITVAPSAITGITGQPITGSFSASGGVAPYTFAASNAGDLTVNPDGSYSATPAAAETVSFTVSATDTNGATGEVSVTLTVTDAPAA